MSLVAMEARGVQVNCTKLLNYGEMMKVPDQFYYKMCKNNEINYSNRVFS